MLARYRFLPLLLMLLAAASCSKKTAQEQAAEMAQTDGDEIDPYSNLVFTFDEKVVDEAQQNRWDTTRYVTFSPNIRGKFKWTGDRELTFSPLEPFRPSTVFSASLRPETLPSDKQKLALNRPKFHTPYLNMAAPQVFYGSSKRAAGTAELRANLVFNYPVRPADVKSRLKVTQGGKPVAVEVNSAEPDAMVAVTFMQDVQTGTPVQIDIAPGLRPAAGTKATDKALSAQAEIPDQSTLEVRELTGSLLNGQPVVTLLLNQPVSATDIQPNLTVKPAVAFSVEALESGFALRGGFEVGKTYQVSLAAGTRGLLGGTLGEAFTQAVSFGDERPSLSFTSSDKAMYLDALGNRNLGLRINEVAKVKVTIAKVYANNIQQLLRGEKQYGYPEYDEDEPRESNTDENGDYIDRSFQYYDTENIGNVLSERTISVDGLPKEGGLRLLNLNLKDLEFQGPLKGLYVIRVQDTERQWLQVSKLVAVTDLGLIVKQGATGGTTVFANSIRTAEPLSGVTVNLISSNNQVIGTTTTDKSGVAQFDSAASMKRFTLGMITATKEADFSFLDLTKSRVETSRFEVGGLTSNTAHYQAFLYGDRNLYRPGDTVRTNTVIRTEDWKTPAAGLPLKIRLLLPSGKEYSSLQQKLSAAGSFESRFILPPTIMTGLYTMEVLTGNDVLLTSRQISVEEFIPDRMKVTVTAAPKILKPGQDVTARITAVNLFGPPAADRKFEVEFSLKQKAFSAPKYPDFNFTINSGEKRRTTNDDGEASESALTSRFEKTVREGSTDAAGLGTATYSVPDYRDLGTLEGVAFATVFDETGRPVNRLATFDVQTQATMFGIGNLPDLISTKQALTVKLLALTPGGKPTSAPAEIKVVRKLWETVLERQGGRYVYNSQQRDQTILSQSRTVGAETSFSFTPVYSGEYEVRISRPGATSYVTQQFYAYGYGDTQANSFEVNNEGEVTIEADKPKYEPGETANLLLKSPFAGRILVTVERANVLDYFYVSTDGKAAEVKIPIKAEHVPNVYVTATAVRAHTAQDRLPLTVARGFLPLTVEKADSRLAVAIAAPAASRSQTWQTVEITTAPRAQLTLAVVDEGILQLKNYQTPDPHAYFYQKRALEVAAFDVYPFLLPELGTSSSGGDAADMRRRTNPVPNRRVKLVSKWSGVLTADGDGKIRYRVRVPQFSGALRIMAVAYKDDAFGSAEATMKVADPVVISTALPRFMSPGDTIDVPVTLTNTTGKPLNVTVGVEVSGPIKVREAGTDSPWTLPIVILKKLKPNTEQRALFHAYASQQIGNAQVKILIKSRDDNKPISEETIDLPIRPAASLEKRTGSGVVAGGATLPLNLKTDFLPSSLTSRLVVSRSPLTEFSKDLRYLLQYPYGCLEQTVSAAFPQLYYADLAATLQQKSGAGPKAQRYNPNYHVQEAIRKIESMQLYNGSLSYWPGGDYDNWWATAYAAHFLQEAQQAGFAVNKSVLDKVLKYLAFRLKKRETEPYQYFDVSNIARQRTIASKEIAYSLYVLALAGRQDPVAMNYYRANRPLLAEDSRFLLACTQSLLGNQRAFRELLPTRFGGERAARRALDGSFYSPIRDEGLILNVLVSTDPNNPQIPGIARQLSRQLKQAPWLSTQESVFALLAFGKIARQNAKSTATASLTIDGKPAGNFDGKDLTLRNVANRNVSIRTAGKGSIYYFWETEGISASGQVREEDSYLKVRRQFLTRDGAPLGAPTFRQNDLVVVRISIESGDAAGEIKNVAITDLLPAGLEIENPRIGALRELAWAKDASTPDYLDVRDDRINMFTTATGTPKHFYYLCRAVSKGTFKLGPVNADAMYNAEYHSYNGAGVVRVR
ncbi:alpha-2-macroglobulin family protein [Microvirga sp. STS02]|uniref:alpha-2-macroglobulin family protein n=1 Tax=Hymenobacter negativus TaxID=2795026 RepID=UPI0018DE6229|nr:MULTISPECIES: MG2 domain-containing protein [Bacteria]MBH8567960.1 alpha-2-macroglobulin family protein [Hymenobacter negativus]MBR7207696.1 alpha-2-macroglobulin family protein [Microvirga sp. STS02]